jgi:transposase
MSPEYVRPYVKARKNDDRMPTRPTIRFVELKSAEQLDLPSLHRVSERTALMNQLRAVLMERGITVPKGRRKLEQHPAVTLDGEELRRSWR